MIELKKIPMTVMITKDDNSEGDKLDKLLKTGEATGKPRVEAMRRQLVLAWLRHRSKHPAAAT